jgi:hypothetical protein
MSSITSILLLSNGIINKIFTSSKTRPLAETPSPSDKPTTLKPITALVAENHIQKIGELWRGDAVAFPKDLSWNDFKTGELLGLRHVSSLKQAKHEQLNGVEFGCSLNLSFGTSETEREPKFKNLHLQIKRTTPKKRNELIKSYEQALINFIVQSIFIDLSYEAPEGQRVADLVREIAQKTHFMVISYENFYSSTDSSYDIYGGAWKVSERVNLSRKNHSSTNI